MADPLDQPRYCHAVVARLIEHPDRLATDDRTDLDTGRLREIAGFIAKVRHNPIRFRLPLTMRALAAAGIEIDFFADFAPEFSRRRRAGLTDEERLDLFVSALAAWLRPDEEDAHRLVADVLAHERTLLELADHEPVPPPDPTAVVDGGSRPRRRDAVRVLHLTVHPPDVGTAPGALDRGDRCYAYIPTPAGPRVKSIAPALAPLLELADGRRTVADITTAFGLDDVAPVFEVWVRRGLADVEPR